MIYLYLLITSLTLSFLGAYLKSKWPYWLIVLILILFSGFRYNVGIDYNSYVDIFVYGFETNEVGYLYFIELIKFLGGTQQLIFFLFALGTIILVALYINKYSPLPYLSMITYICIGPFFLASLSGIRHYFAISIFLFCLKYVVQQKIKPFLIIMIFAGITIHASLLFLIPTYFFLHKKVKQNHILLIIIICLLSNPLLNIIIEYSSYATYFVKGVNVKISPTIYLYLVISFGLMFLARKSSNILYNLNFLSFLSLLLLFVNQKLPNDLFLRMNNYFFFSQIILIPLLIKSIKDHTNKTYVIFSYLFGIILYFLTTVFFKGEFYKLLPYDTNFLLF